MKYKVIKSFVGHYYDLDTGQKIQVSAGMGEIIDVPQYQTDWENAGLMQPLESAMLAGPKAKGGGAPLAGDVPGVAGYADELEALGIVTAADLATAPVTQVQTIKGVGAVTARRWRDAARALLSGGG